MIDAVWEIRCLTRYGFDYAVDVSSNMADWERLTPDPVGNGVLDIRYLAVHGPLYLRYRVSAKGTADSGFTGEEHIVAVP